MENGLVKLDPKEYGLEESRAKEVEAVFLPMIEKMKELENEYNSIISEPISIELCKKARELRLKYVKVRTGTADIHKKAKAFYLAGSKFVDGWKNSQLYVSQGIEEKLETIEKHYERQEAERIKKLQEERSAEYAKYKTPEMNLVPDPDFGHMSEDIWSNFITGAKNKYEALMASIKKAEEDKKAEEERIKKEKERVEAERKAEEERIRKENERLQAEKLRLEEEAKKKEEEEKARIEAERKEKERIEKEHQAKLEEERRLAEQQRKEQEEKERKEREKIEAENKAKLEAEKKEKERLLKEQEEKNRIERERIEKENAEKLAKEKAEKEKIEAELKAKKEEEEKRLKAEQEKKEAELLRLKKEQQAPDKEKLIVIKKKIEVLVTEVKAVEMKSNEVIQRKSMVIDNLMDAIHSIESFITSKEA